ncbi:MAG TPA: Crp/Fnr family transcriptional regulator [Bacillus bacterium]|nr:Crp/Fnr family transcriptional regulator [Bacillus sp. (in: firmicutes)]
MHVAFLKSIPFFKDLPDHLIGSLSTKVKTATYKKGDFIFHESDEAKATFFVKNGGIKIKKTNAQGRELIVCIKRPGNIFAEASLFSEPDCCYPGAAQTLMDSEVLYILSSDLEEFIACNPELSIEMIRFMGGQLRSFTTILQDIALLDVYSKTVKTIERLARDFGSKTNCGLKIELPITIQDLANTIGSTRESVSRIVSKLREQGLISIDSKYIIINNWCDFCKMFVETVET